jgi:hypothetical protein
VVVGIAGKENPEDAKPENMAAVWGFAGVHDLFSTRADSYNLRMPQVVTVSKL